MGSVSSKHTTLLGEKLKPLSKGIIVGVITMGIYLGVVIITTPALAPLDAVSAAFQINSVIIFGMGAGVGLQMYLSSYSKKLGCRLNIKKKTFGGNTGGTAFTSFLSFFSLVPLGCCGWWLYALSLLPSVFGTGISAILIEYNQPLSYLGLVIIFGFSGLTAYKLRQEHKILKMK